MADFPPLPPGEAPLTISQLARLLAAGFPDEAQAVAEATLAAEILPYDLRSVATHPRPRRLTEVVYEQLVADLGAVPRADRPARLDDVRCDRAAGHLAERAGSLAIARYVADRGMPRGFEADGFLEPARADIGRPRDELLAEVERTEQALATWKGDAEQRSWCWTRHRITSVHATMWLDAARSGSFDAAAGPLYDFLRAAGESPRRLDIH